MKNPCDTCFDAKKECRYCNERHEWLIEAITNECNGITGNTQTLVAVGKWDKEKKRFSVKTELTNNTGQLPAVLNYGNLINGSTTR